MFLQGHAYHVSRLPVDTLRITRGAKSQVPMKPTGLWYAWTTTDEDPSDTYPLKETTTAGYIYEVILPDRFVDYSSVVPGVDYSGYILRLYPLDVAKFTREFLKESYPGWPSYPDWMRLQTLFGGIDFAEYTNQLFPGRTEHCWWYSTVDFASGCVWDPEAVGVTVRLIRGN